MVAKIEVMQIKERGFTETLDRYQYLGRRRYETEPFKFTTKRLM